MAKRDKESEYYEYLLALYDGIPDNKKKLVEGLIREAARLRVSLDELWEDIKKNGNVEVDEKGREKERPASAIWTARDKSYRATIKHLDSLLPANSHSTGFSKLDGDEDEEDDI